MSEGQAENTTTTEAPAPAAGTSSASAPSTAPAATEKKPVGNDAGKPADKQPVDFFRDREAKRERKATERLAEIEKENAALKADLEKHRTSAPAPVSEEVFSLDDPEGSFKKMEERATKNALAAFEEQLAQKEAVGKYVQRAHDAEKFLLTRSHLKDDPNAQAEIAEILGKKYLDIADFKKGGNPQAAADLAYYEWCRSKGVTPDVEGFKAPANAATGGRASVGAPPSAPANGGKRVFKKGEAAAYIDAVKPSDPEHKRRVAEIDEAYKEGRVEK